jgi:hypothetical protein
MHKADIILSRSMCDYRWGLDWRIDLLTTYMWELEITITLSLFPHFTVHYSTQSNVLSVTIRFLVTASTMAIRLHSGSRTLFTDSRTELN